MEQVQAILEKVTGLLRQVSGVEAVVLGGSRARGTQGPGSDIDIGIYYAQEALLDLPGLSEAARLLDDDHRENLVSPPGGWGRWVNGGGWLTVDGIALDLILRDLARVKTAMEECQAGQVSAHYQPGHPHGFLNAMYRGELAVCRLLWDRSGAVGALKAGAEVYPPAMKSTILGSFGFEAGFSLMLAKRYAEKNDPYYVTAHLVRAVSSLNQVLFALNEQYCLNEKKAVAMIAAFPIHPEAYKDRIADIFAAGADLTRACALLSQLTDEVNALAKDTQE